MAEITVAEALAELKTALKRLEMKRTFILTYLHRPEMLKDPLSQQGGSFSAIQQEWQSIRNLEEQIILIRRAVQQAYERCPVTISNQTRSLADWLVWRREVTARKARFLSSMLGRIDRARLRANRRAAVLLANGQTLRANDIAVNLDET